MRQLCRLALGGRSSQLCGDLLQVHRVHPKEARQKVIAEELRHEDGFLGLAQRTVAKAVVLGVIPASTNTIEMNTTTRKVDEEGCNVQFIHTFLCLRILSGSDVQFNQVIRDTEGGRMVLQVFLIRLEEFLLSRPNDPVWL